MKHGFKAEAERISTELRAELNLDSDARLDPRELAEHLAIPIINLTRLSRAAQGSSFGPYFTDTAPDSFSAVTVFEGYSRFIVHNDTHHPHRQSSNLTHEISHTVLEHDPAPVAASDGNRFWDSEIEEEASWLGAALLVPREAALQMILTGCTPEEIAVHFGVSDALCKWRIRQTGILQHVERMKRWRH
ncbi:MAG TPA: ImmA/IrrE family metallo-endopeptidase [Candidatus Angelobacter sp.]|nr:ImmA/IrrE family metallo-endopeptidase [Candidatus Angelobacter sp.]